MITIELNDQYTGERTSFLETDLTYDNQLINEDIWPEIYDEILYKKIDNKYYRRVLIDDTVNIKWFGAKGDGVTDDSIPIQKAINSSHSIRIDSGEYLINSPIIIGIKFSGLSIKGCGADKWYDLDEIGHRTKPYTVLLTKTANSIFKGDKGLNFFKISDILFEGNNIGSIAMDFVNGGGLVLDRVTVKHFTEYGLRSEEGLLRINNCFFENNIIGAQIYSDSSISNSEFTGGSIPLKLVAGGNRLVNIWCNSGKETCLHIEPLNYTTGHQNTSITNLYIGEVKNVLGEAYAMRIIGNNEKRVQQIQISNSFFVHAEGLNKSINGLVYLNNADEIIFNSINVLGKGANAKIDDYTSHFIRGANSERITINSCVVNGINKNAIYQGENCHDWEILNNTFINCGDTIAKEEEEDGANIYVSETVWGRTSIIGNKFLVSSNSYTPYAAYISSINSLNWGSNFISYPNNNIIVKTPDGINNFSGSSYISGIPYQKIRKIELVSSYFESGSTLPTVGLQNAQFFYLDTFNKPIWYDAQDLLWRDAYGINVNLKRSGITLDRPTGNLELGFRYFDSTLGIPIYWQGTTWVKADGTNA